MSTFNRRVVACLTFADGVTEDQVNDMIHRMAEANKLENGYTQIMDIQDEYYPIAYQP